MEKRKISCAICAWREHCNKKYYIKDPSKCLDFSRDLTLDIEDEEEEEDKKNDKD